MWPRNLAFSRAAIDTHIYLKQGEVAALPCTPKDADCNPLDFFVWNSVKEGLKRSPAETRDTFPELSIARVRIITEVRGGTEGSKTAALACKSAPKRDRRVVDNGRRRIVGRLWR